MVFGINQAQQKEYFDDYRVEVRKKGKYDFKVGVKTPAFYSYDVVSYLGVKLGDYAPYVIKLQQIAQIPEIACPK